LTFGSYRRFWENRCLEEGIFYADDLPESDYAVLKQYVSSHGAETDNDGDPQLKLLNREQFVDLFFKRAYKRRDLIVAFNFPFDVSRLAFDFKPARGRFAGGFAIELWSYIDSVGCVRPDPNRPRIDIKHIDSKRALKGFSSRRKLDAEDRIPEGSETGEPEKNYNFRGHSLDLRTLTFALTDRGHTLESACKAFGVEHGKQQTSRHGVVAEGYIDYNRADVRATAELAFKALEEYRKHPITLQATKAYSPASIGKAYLEAMGIPPILQRQPNFPKAYLGYAETAFFGGRASAHIRKASVPVVYTDFLSMYPTVNSLMRLWSFVIAQEITVTERCGLEVEQFLTDITAEALFAPETWKDLCGFVKVIPNGDILPSRAKYSESNDWQVAVNYIYGNAENPKDALWYSLPDVVVSVLLTGRIPKIVDAFRIEPVGVLSGLRSVKLRNAIRVDPKEEDFFRVVIEQRKGLPSRKDLGDNEKERLNKALKVLANATSYGIYAEMNREESDRPVDVVCNGIDAEPFKCRVPHPDVPGRYCFPPLAALITGGARLMLALLENRIGKLGGTYAMEDTDSMAIVATERGGDIACPEAPGLKALSWKQVEEVAAQFVSLNPYDRRVVSSILKIEDDNFDPETRKQRQLYCFALSAKRYVLFLSDKEDGEPTLLRDGVNNNDDRWSQHGLGHLLNPTDLTSEDRQWIAHVWLDIVRRAMGLAGKSLVFESLPAVGRITISSPAVLKPLARLNVGKKYVDQLKPFNFLLTCHVRRAGHPTGREIDQKHFHLVAPYESDPSKWSTIPWIDQYTGNQHAIMTAGNHGTRNAARVKTYNEVVREYEFHAESKCADISGNTCDKQTVGLLQRRHVQIDCIKYIGKESNSLEEVEAGIVHAEQNVYTEYPDPRRDEWLTRLLPALKVARLADLIIETGMSKRALLDLRAGRSRPHAKNLAVIRRALQKLNLI
jgi:hypothetical protein